jgi:hypothetical protein
MTFYSGQPKPEPSLVLSVHKLPSPATQADLTTPDSCRMQRVLHSIMTARILLNIREAAARDLGKNAPIPNGTSTALSFIRPDQPETRQARSRDIIGMDTWSTDSETTTERAIIDMA